MSTKQPRKRALDHISLSKPTPTTPTFTPRVIEFYRGKKDNYVAFPFDKLVWVNFYKSKGIILHFASHTVHVVGSNIEDVYHGVRDQTLRSIGPALDAIGPKTKGVEAVYIKQVGSNSPGFVWPSDESLKKEDA